MQKTIGKNRKRKIDEIFMCAVEAHLYDHYYNYTSQPATVDSAKEELFKYRFAKLYANPDPVELKSAVEKTVWRYTVHVTGRTWYYVFSTVDPASPTVKKMKETDMSESKFKPGDRVEVMPSDWAKLGNVAGKTGEVIQETLGTVALCYKVKIGEKEINIPATTLNLIQEAPAPQNSENKPLTDSNCSQAIDGPIMVTCQACGGQGVTGETYGEHAGGPKCKVCKGKGEIEADRPLTDEGLKHTPNPWATLQPRKTIFIGYKQDKKRPIIIARMIPKQKPGLNKTYADRIVVCLNACEGINPEAVKDLLEACKDSLESWSHYKGDSHYEKIQKAVDKAEGR